MFQEVGKKCYGLPDSNNKKHKLFCKRAGIEPTIGHLKSDYRLGRNFYKGVAGDTVNVLLAPITSKEP